MTINWRLKGSLAYFFDIKEFYIELWFSLYLKKKPLDFSRGFCITGGSGEIRTRDQQIKRSHASSKVFTTYGFERLENKREIDCANANLLGYGIRCNFLSTSLQKRLANSSSGVND